MVHTSMFQKHIHKVKFYPRAVDFTQALLVMLVTNIMSALAYTQNPKAVDTNSCLFAVYHDGVESKKDMH